MSDNYEEETLPLFRHLRTEAFRFIVVRFNHYDLFRRLEADLKSRFPDRALQKINAEKATFQSLSEAYYAQKNGFFWIENFDSILREPDTRLAENQEQALAEKDRRHRITAGMNLRRDTFAKSPIALFVFVRADQELYARMMMDKMPDLWSFRSLLLDLEKEIEVPANQNTVLQGIENTNVQILEKEQRTAKIAELESLQNQLAHTPATEIAYRRTLYPQIADLQTELGKYEAALINLEEWEQIDEDKAQIWFKKGDIYTTIGKIDEAQNAFEQALNLYEKKGEKNNTAVCYQRLGDTYASLGNLEKALDFYEKYHHLREELYQSYPSNVEFKNGLAISYCKLGETNASLGNLERSLSFSEK
jgi:tetratricopeptide (TPR) repeat protein